MLFVVRLQIVYRQQSTNKVKMRNKEFERKYTEVKEIRVRINSINFSILRILPSFYAMVVDEDLQHSTLSY